MNLLIVALLLAQDKTAEEAFKKIEETLEKAKTVRMEFASEFAQKRGGTDFVFKIDGELFLKEGNRARFTCATRVMDQTDEFMTVCDGTRMVVRQPRKEATPKDASKDFVADLQATFLRGGIYLVFASNVAQKIPKKDLKGDLAPIDLQHGPDEKDLRTLTYKIKFPEGSLDCVLRYDPKTWIPSGRTMKFLKDGADVGTAQETYKAFRLDTDLADDMFKLDAVPEKSLAAKVSAAKGDIAGLTVALGAYEIDNGRYPTSEEGLAALVAKPPAAKNWKGPYISEKRLPFDPWGNTYVYAYPGVRNPKSFDLSSNGPDGKPGTDDDVRWY